MGPWEPKNLVSAPSGKLRREGHGLFQALASEEGHRVARVVGVLRVTTPEPIHLIDREDSAGKPKRGKKNKNTIKSGNVAGGGGGVKGPNVLFAVEKSLQKGFSLLGGLVENPT